MPERRLRQRVHVGTHVGGAWRLGLGAVPHHVPRPLAIGERLPHLHEERVPLLDRQVRRQKRPLLPSEARRGNPACLAADTARGLLRLPEALAPVGEPARGWHAVRCGGRRCALIWASETAPWREAGLCGARAFGWGHGALQKPFFG